MMDAGHATVTDTPPIEKNYAEVNGRAAHYRTCGSGPSVVLLHDSPRSSRLHLDTMRQLGRQFRVYCLDTPGYGNSDPIGLPNPTIGDFGSFLDETLAVLGISHAPLYATHTSAKIALSYAAGGAATPLLILDGLSIPAEPATEEFIASYLRPFQPDASGAYLAREWSHVRDMLRWFPWFDNRSENRIAMEAPSPEWMADYVIDLCAAGPNYCDAYAPALRYAPMDDLQRCRVPTIVAAREDDVLYSYLDRVPLSSNPHLAVERIAPDRATWLAWLEERLEAACDRQSPSLPSTKAHGRREGASYVRATHGQIRFFRAGPAKGVPLLILDTPTTRHALTWQQALAEVRDTIVPDLPGFGESDPLPNPTSDDIADCLAALLDGLDVTRVDVLGLGLASGLAVDMAARHPGRVRGLALDGVPPVDIAAAAAMAKCLCPEFPFDAAAGAHLHRIWHMLRDSEVQWPWFDPSPAAARTIAPSFEATSLHRALTEILKQHQSYGDAALAALRDGSGLARYSKVKAPTLLFTHPTDPAYADVGAVAACMQAAHPIARPASIEAAASRLHGFLECARETAKDSALPGEEI